MGWMDERALLRVQEERAGCVGADMGVTFSRGDTQSQAQCIRGERSVCTPYTHCGSTTIFQQSAVGFFHVKSMEVPILQDLTFCEAVTDFDCEYGT